MNQPATLPVGTQQFVIRRALVQLTSDKQRADAHRFYLRLGFTASHEGFKLLLLRFGPVTRSRESERKHHLTA